MDGAIIGHGDVSEMKSTPLWFKAARRLFVDER
jgi:hypothetical protein